MEDSKYTEARQSQIDRLQKNADRLFSLGNVRERCQAALISFQSDLQPSPFATWGTQLNTNSEYRFALSLTLSYKSTMNEIVQWAKGCQGEYLLQEVQEERKRRIEKFAQMRITSRWYQMKDDDVAWRVFSQNIPFNQADSEIEVHEFFELLDRISILTDILLGYASEYGLKVDYSKIETTGANMSSDNDLTLSSSRQAIINQLLGYADKGEWAKGVTSDDVKTMLKAVLGRGETPLKDRETTLSEMLWKLLENGRGDRVKIVWQNMVGYFDDKKLLKMKGSPALNKDFFGTEENYSNIDKGRPSRENMSSGFRDILPLLDAYVPKV